MPFLRRIESKHVFWLLAMFWSVWLYTEITEYVARDAFAEEVNKFMYQGDRFTKERGDALDARLRRIEELEGLEHNLKEE